MQKWEYREICLTWTKKGWNWDDTGIASTAIGVSSRLTQMGQEGWELVSAYPQTTNEQGGSFTKFIYYIFKRPLS